MLELSTPVAALSKVGPKYKSLLEKLEIYTIGDLVYHFPFRYDDFSVTKRIVDLQDGETATIQGILGKVNNIYTKYGKRLTKSTIIDDTGTLELVWFSSHYLKKVLKPNKRYSISGKVGSFSGKLSIIAPNYEEMGKTTVNTGRLVPVYPETAGVSSKWLRTKISEVLKNSLLTQEFLPDTILKKEHFQTVQNALNSFHFPTTLTEASQAKKRFQFEELFLELINVELRKNSWEEQLKSPVINSLIYEDDISNLVDSLPFELTPSQKQAVLEIRDSLKKYHPMNRLLEGDVGTGKTIVAVIAAYISSLNNFNTLYMAPTEILAKQHFETFSTFLRNYNISINLLTSSSKIQEKSDKPFINIGTHALLFNKNYSNLGLIVIDEQHRFGVEQRTELQNLNKGELTPHLLTMTATPIPRTLALTIYGDLEISALQAPPNKTKNINTKVVPEKKREEAYEWIRKSKEQTFIVCPFIEESMHEDFENVKAATAEYEKLKQGVFKDLKLGLLHGRLKSKEKQEVVERFEKGKIRILVSTPVIEVGIDIPDATIIVIESAERYGLASLHQLRGRVGRRDKPGYCFIFMGSNNRNAYKRLKYLENINDGLELAEVDMQLRGSGDIYGTMQHGFKKFKVARLSDTKTLEKAKKYATKYFPNIDKYPLLKARVYEKSGRFVGNN